MVFSDPPSIPNSTQDSGIQMVVATQATVRMLPIFSGLSVAATEHLSKKITLVRASRGSNIVLETEPADSVYFIVAGFVKVVRGNVSDRYAIAVLSPGDIFGELGAITGSGRNASVIALTTCTLARLGKDEFLRCVDATPSVASFMVRYLARRQTPFVHPLVEDGEIDDFAGDAGVVAAVTPPQPSPLAERGPSLAVQRLYPLVIHLFSSVPSVDPVQIVHDDALRRRS